MASNDEYQMRVMWGKKECWYNRLMKDMAEQVMRDVKSIDEMIEAAALKSEVEKGDKIKTNKNK